MINSETDRLIPRNFRTDDWQDPQKMIIFYQQEITPGEFTTSSQDWLALEMNNEEVKHE